MTYNPADHVSCLQEIDRLNALIGEEARLILERDQLAAEMAEARKTVAALVLQNCEFANIWAICHESSPDDCPDPTKTADIRRDVDAMQDREWAHEARANKAEAERDEARRQVAAVAAKCAELRSIFDRQSIAAALDGNTEAVGLRGDRLGVVLSIESALAATPAAPHGSKPGP